MANVLWHVRSGVANREKGAKCPLWQKSCGKNQVTDGEREGQSWDGNGKNLQDSFTLPLLTARAGYAPGFELAPGPGLVEFILTLVYTCIFNSLTFSKQYVQRPTDISTNAAEHHHQPYMAIWSHDHHHDNCCQPPPVVWPYRWPCRWPIIPLALVFGSWLPWGMYTWNHWQAWMDSNALVMSEMILLWE